MMVLNGFSTLRQGGSHHVLQLAPKHGFSRVDSGCRGSYLRQLWWFSGGVLTSAAAVLYLGRADPFDEQAGALRGPGMPWPACHGQSRSGNGPRHAALDPRLGRVLLAGTSAFRASLVGTANS